MWTIYLIENVVTGLRYVGQTRRSVGVRFAGHCREVRSNLILHRAIQKYGKKAFIVTVINECETQDEANAAESFWIGALGTLKPGGYNLHPGGSLKVSHTADIRLKMSESAKRRGPSVNAIAALSKYWGRPHSEEARAKIGAANKSRIWTEESKLKASLAKMGKKRGPLSEDHKRKMSIAKKGWKPTNETRNKMSLAKKGKDAWYGKTMPRWIAEKISRSLKGKPKSDEWKEKLSEAQLKYLASHPNQHAKKGANYVACRHN